MAAMITVIAVIAVGCTVFALIGALGERMMRYGRKNGIVKGAAEDGMDREASIHVIIKHVGSDAYFADIENSDDAFCALVGGSAERTLLAKDLAVFCSEDACMNGERYNVSICGKQFFGTLLVCGVRGDEAVGLPIEDGTARRVLCSLFADGGKK